MNIEQTWRVNFAKGVAASDAGVVYFAKSGKMYQITRVEIKNDFHGLRVRLCHQALNAIKVADYEERVQSSARRAEHPQDGSTTKALKEHRGDRLASMVHWG